MSHDILHSLGIPEEQGSPSKGPSGGWVSCPCPTAPSHGSPPALRSAGPEGQEPELRILSPPHSLLPPSSSLPTAQPPLSSTLVFLSWKQKLLLLFLPCRQTCDMAPEEGPMSR